jgi:hypothetical protein
MQRHRSNFVLAYQGADDERREARDQFWTGIADVLAYSVVWGALVTLVAALLGSLALWGVLLATSAQ